MYICRVETAICIDLIRFSTVCLKNVLLEIEYKWKKSPNIPYNGNGLVQLIRMGNSIQLKQVVFEWSFFILKG